MKIIIKVVFVLRIHTQKENNFLSKESIYFVYILSNVYF